MNNQTLILVAVLVLVAVVMARNAAKPKVSGSTAAGTELDALRAQLVKKPEVFNAHNSAEVVKRVNNSLEAERQGDTAAAKVILMRGAR